MKYAWITAHRDLYPIVSMCEALDVSKSGYYDFVDRKPSPRAERRERIHATVRAVHAESQAIYGSHKITRELAGRDDLESACRNTVAQAMREMGLSSRVSSALTPMTTKSDPTKRPALKLGWPARDVECPHSGKILAGGFAATALQRPKQFTSIPQN